MWPKALAQLIELAPHIVRMVPMADRFFSSKTAGEEANRRAMEAMAEGLRGDLGQVTASHAGLYRQLNDQSEKLANIAADVRATQIFTEASEARLDRMEQWMASNRRLLFAAIVLNILLLAVVIVLLLRH